MQLYDAETLARRLILLHVPHISFQWSRTKNAYGDYNSYYRRIRLSKVLVPLMTAAEVEDTVMHEIAHAMCPADEGHGPLWRKTMISLGRKPEARSRIRAHKQLATMPGNWVGMCPNGHKLNQVFTRKPRVDRSCNKCCPGSYNPAFKFEYTKL